MHFKIVKKIAKLKRRLYGLPRGHHVILSAELERLLSLNIKHLVLIETGCIRSLSEGTESTLTISSIIKDRGTFYTFDLNPDHIATCKQLCKDYNAYINYVEGDSVTNLAAMVKDNTLAKIDFAYLDSLNDGDHTWKEFQAIEGLFRKGSILVVDDVLWAKKGKIIRPYLEQSKDWDVTIHNVENGILVADRL